MKVGIIGTGYVGLVTGVSLSKVGHDVTCYDKDKKLVDKLNNGIPHIYEKGLKALLSKSLFNKKFKVKLFKEFYPDYDIIIIAVGTPSNDDGSINLNYIKEASSNIGKSLKNFNKFVSIVIKSTVLPGTTDEFVRKIIEKESSKKIGEFGLGMNPEFLREGNAIEDFTFPDRIVIGYEDNETLSRLEILYNSWNCDKLKVNTRTAEMIKYANNSILATQISMTNELANLVARLGGIDIEDVMRGVHKDKRWNPIINNKRINPEILSYLKAGCGFGGSCFPKDVKALNSLSKNLNLESLILDSVLKINDNQPFEIINILKGYFDNLKNKSFLILGLSFKPNTDDVRDSISLKVIDFLQKKSAIYLLTTQLLLRMLKNSLQILKYIFYKKLGKMN